MIITSFILRFLGNALTFIGISIVIFTYVPILYTEILYAVNPPNQEALFIEDQRDTGPDFENIQVLNTADEEFSIIINKIGVNAPIVPEVTTVDHSIYTEALKHGVAHAKGTALPGEDGNTFLFAHSSLNFWQLGEYATVFNLLGKLEEGDSVIVMHDSKPYLYEVFDMATVNGWNTAPFDVEYDEPVLTMVTCSPPGSTINRLVVKARRVT